MGIYKIIFYGRNVPACKYMYIYIYMYVLRESCERILEEIFSARGRIGSHLHGVAYKISTSRLFLPLREEQV